MSYVSVGVTVGVGVKVGVGDGVIAGNNEQLPKCNNWQEAQLSKVDVYIEVVFVTVWGPDTTPSQQTSFASKYTVPTTNWLPGIPLIVGVTSYTI